jgi:hypothetical protein
LRTIGKDAIRLKTGSARAGEDATAAIRAPNIKGCGMDLMTDLRKAEAEAVPLPCTGDMTPW